jgi:hypothetical protein
MRRTLFVAASLLAAPLQFAGVPAAFAAGTAAVENELATATSEPDEHGATVMKGIICGIFIPIPGALPAVTQSSHLVVTPSGNAALICHGKIPVGPPQAVVVNDIPCSLGPGGGATKSHTVVSPSGNVLLTCHNHPPG